MAYALTEMKTKGVLVTWDAITGATSGTALELSGEGGTVGCIQVTAGTAGSVSLEGSLDGTNWAPLDDLQGDAIALTALTQIAEFTTSVRFIRPTGNGSSSGAVVRVLLRG